MSIRSCVTVSLVEAARGGPFVFWDDLPAACRQAHELGFDAIEIFPPSPSALDVEAVRKLLADQQPQAGGRGHRGRLGIAPFAFDRHRARRARAGPAICARHHRRGRIAGRLGHHRLDARPLGRRQVDRATALELFEVGAGRAGRARPAIQRAAHLRAA